VILIQALLAISIALSLWFAREMWPPWRSADPTTAWLLFSWACTAASLETVFLAATLSIEVPALLALLVIVAHDAVMVWRMVKVRQARRTKQPAQTEE
jgi:hypothetical protein